MVSQARNRVVKYSTAAPLESKKGLENVVLHPSLKRRIEHLARATANTKTHQAPFRNMLFYGPPGTGKTMVAREIAQKSVCGDWSSHFFLLHTYCGILIPSQIAALANCFLGWSNSYKFLNMKSKGE